ncbi:MAG TPA: lipid-A-disaccharide synthase, partial [Verrucomicrobiae bacterium]|nr:lipid-A-disaccharide synthase [Verrucomicrobiae bacterium]
PKLRVEFVGHPVIGRYPGTNRSGDAQNKIGNRKSEIESQFDGLSAAPQILLLPGSRASELRMHLPVMLPALTLIRAKIPEAKAKTVLPDENLARLAGSFGVETEIQIGNLPEALARADVAIASTGTVTMECAFFGVPTATLYKTSWFTYQIAKRIVTVESLTMPNLLAGRKIYPEYIQDAATPENLAAATLDLLRDQCRRRDIKSQLEKIISSLGEPGASNRAAAAILGLFP